MRFSVLVALLLLGASWTVNRAESRPPQPQGTTYIYPDGTVGYYVWLNGYRSDYYIVPAISTGYYGPRAYGGATQRYPYAPGSYDYHNGSYMNYPGAYYQNQPGYWRP